MRAARGCRCSRSRRPTSSTRPGGGCPLRRSIASSGPPKWASRWCARAGGTGTRFNLGEITVTRCSVELADGTVGHAYVGGRRRRHAELAAVLDALLQQPERRPAIEAAVITPLARAQAERRRAVAARSAPTRVEFFTMVRGDD